MARSFHQYVAGVTGDRLLFERLEVLQVNTGDRCNLRCAHCHHRAGPDGMRIMDLAVVEGVIAFLRANTGLTLDITGGSPELNPHFVYFVESARPLVKRLIFRSNLVLFAGAEPPVAPEWCAEHDLAITASLPCYTAEGADRQRGAGVFDAVVNALKILNRCGYGDTKELNLVFNPGGPVLPGAQEALEADYREQLLKNHNVRFSRLLTIVNAPIGRFRDSLISRRRLSAYQRLLEEHFNPRAIPRLMCRTLISVDPQGVLFNCDFNQALHLPIRDSGGFPLTLTHLPLINTGRPIVTGPHCFACAAGAGSSCSGALL